MGIKRVRPGSVMLSGRALTGGGYLLSHFRSTIGVAGFNFSVRNGKRWSPRAIATLVRLSSSSVFTTCKVKKERLETEMQQLSATTALRALMLSLVRRRRARFPYFSRRRLSLGGLAPGKGLGD